MRITKQFLMDITKPSPIPIRHTAIRHLDMPGNRGIEIQRQGGFSLTKHTERVNTYIVHRGRLEHIHRRTVVSLYRKREVPRIRL